MFGFIANRLFGFITNRYFVLDRYTLGLFGKVLVLSFFCLAGLYIVIDFMSNFQEFNSYGKKVEGGLGTVVADYYLARVYWFFDLTGGVIAMMAGIFAVTWMQRSNELTAVAAAGISPARMVRPLILAAVGVAALGVVNRELLLPRVREKLARNAQDWMGESAKTCRPMWDLQTNILISGKTTMANEKRIESPTFSQLPAKLSSWGRQITAANAYFQPPRDGRPGGYLLRGIRQPANFARLKSASLEGVPVLLSPLDTPWLKPDECFVTSGVTFEQLTVGSSWQEYLSSWELITGLHNKSLDYGSHVRVTLHARFVRPFLDVTLLFLGLPLVLSMGNRNIFMAGLLCLMVVAAFFGVTMMSHSLGTNYLLSPTLAAWLPLLIFGPTAYAISRPMWE